MPNAKIPSRGMCYYVILQLCNIRRFHVLTNASKLSLILSFFHYTLNASLKIRSLFQIKHVILSKFFYVFDVIAIMPLGLLRVSFDCSTLYQIV